MKNIIERKILSGTWLYDSSVEREVHIIKTNFKPGSGDYEDSSDIRNDQFGNYYGIHLGPYDGVQTFLEGSYISIEEAKEYAHH